MIVKKVYLLLPSTLRLEKSVFNGISLISASFLFFFWVAMESPRLSSVRNVGDT